MHTIEKIIHKAISLIAFGAMLACLAAAMGTLLVQINSYLRTGDWMPISVITALEWAGSTWAASPDGAFGVYKILYATPLSVFLVGLAVLILSIAVSATDS